LAVTATRLTWNAATGVPVGAVVTYTVERSVDGGATWAAVTGSPFAALTTGLTSPAGTNYQYRVAAIATQFGLPSAPSGWTTTTFNTAPAASATPVATGTVPATRSITVKWTNASTNVVGFTIQRRRNNAGAWTTLVAPTVTQAGTTYSITDTSMAAAGSYTYHVLANNAVGSTAYTAASNAIVTP
jgi:hypothetical protein